MEITTCSHSSIVLYIMSDFTQKPCHTSREPKYEALLRDLVLSREPVNNLLLFVGRLIFIVGRLIFIVGRLIFIVGRLIFIVGRIIFIVGRLIFIVGWLIFIVGRLIFIVGRSFLLLGGSFILLGGSFLLLGGSFLLEESLISNHQRKPNSQSRMDNQEKLATFGIQNEDKAKTSKPKTPIYANKHK